MAGGEASTSGEGRLKSVPEGGPSPAVPSVASSGEGSPVDSLVSGDGAAHGGGEGPRKSAGEAAVAEPGADSGTRRVFHSFEDVPKDLTAVRLVSGWEEMNPKCRDTMEDAYVVIDGFGGDKDTGLYAVYDGHGGRFTAEFLRTHLHDNIEKELRVKGKRSVEECLRAAFLMTDIECARANEASSGSTAVLIIVRRVGEKRYVYTANCGDARAVLCHGGTAVRLSMDHKATDPEEVERITAAGGFVARKRVLGILAVARAFGDISFKRYVTAEPYTSTTKLNADSEFIIVACDGIWDVLSDQEAVDLVRSHINASVDAGSESGPGPTRAELEASAGKLLVYTSLKCGSTDNVTAMVVFL